MGLCIMSDRVIPGSDAYQLDLDDFAFAVPPRFDPITEALLARMTVQPSDLRKKLINNLVLGLKDNYLAESDRLYIFAAHDFQAASLDWAQPSGAMSWQGSPTFEADRCVRFTATGDYGNTGFNPFSTSGRKFLQDDASMAMWILNNVATDTISGGYSSSGRACQVFPRASTGSMRGKINYDGALTDKAAIGTSAGLTAITRTSSTASHMSRNGVSVQAITNTSQTPSNTEMRLGVSSAACPYHFAMFNIGGALSPQQQLDGCNALHTYFSGVGALG